MVGIVRYMGPDHGDGPWVDYGPALLLVVELGGDGDAAWTAVEK